MSFVDHAIIWHVYPMGFTAAPVRPCGPEERELTHRLPALIDWLDYAVGLGFNAIQLGPVFESTSHGYDTLDFHRIDPRLGDDGDFDDLIVAAADRGVGILLDGVFNHVSSEHPLVQRALAEGPEGEFAGMFRISFDGETASAETFEGHDGLVEFNHGDPRVADLVTEVMLHWLRRGIAGWRLDAVYAVPAEFWRSVLPRVREEFPEAFIYGEMIHGDYAAYVQQSGVDSITAYELWKATWSSLNDANFFELEWSLRRHNDMLETFPPYTFIGNHDVTRIATKVGPEKAAVAAAVLFTVGGVPAVYYGDEFGMEGEKYERIGGDDEVRPAFPASPADLGESGDWLRRLYHDLISVRRNHSWLVRARVETVELSNTAYTYDCVGEGGERLRVSLTLEPSPSVRITRDGEEIYHFGR
ncbi:alpha-amylase family protein [Corynebacterium sp. CCM 9185]|uniref:Alpha-amylase family protein n=1 Tax=Corynebacterium marambiense TaxID=2765364 RepID=A0ABS0VX81_9CORY|nr:alpha-amylase family protein [Corynebacterium marambiense]MBI8999988.1 alpha-amylase family protein [Corynebacterium marambiense]MCK7663340.1 alpha-amylase family protein [Corynebacterium marambiense]MCX7542226.1 alpha-amylase family protein [Corynebacterium marambiense]